MAFCFSFFLDASKRRQLPAWIREGLEKMERDKQKQLEREKGIYDKKISAKFDENDEVIERGSSSVMSKFVSVLSYLGQDSVYIKLGLTVQDLSLV